MRKLDEACAWLLFLAGAGHLVLLEIYRWRGGAWDTGLLYIFVAMFNLLRIRNREVIRLLMIFCVGANVCALILEIARWSQWLRWYTVAESLHYGLALKSLSVLILLSLETAASTVDMAHRHKQRESAVGEIAARP